MIIKTSLLWQTHQGKKIGLFMGYYDIIEDWSAISKVYFAFSQLTVLVQEVAKLTNPPVQLLRDGNVVHLIHAGECTELPIETITVDEMPCTLYALPASLTPQTVWVNWDRFEDNTQYGWNEVYSALVLALSAGIAAGFSGSKTVDGQTPEEWAWRYVTRPDPFNSLFEGRIPTTNHRLKRRSL